MANPKDAGPVLIAILDCPDKVEWTMKGVCAKSKSDAESKAVKATKPNYSCKPGCELEVKGEAKATGRECVYRLEPEEKGELYDVKLTIRCKKG